MLLPPSGGFVRNWLGSLRSLASRVLLRSVSEHLVEVFPPNAGLHRVAAVFSLMLAEWRDARIRLIYLSGYEKGARDAGEQQTVLLDGTRG